MPSTIVRADNWPRPSWDFQDLDDTGAPLWNEDGTPVVMDLTGSAFVLTIAGPGVRLVLTTANEDLDVDLETNTLSWPITQAQAAKFPLGKPSTYTIQRIIDGKYQTLKLDTFTGAAGPNGGGHATVLLQGPVGPAGSLTEEDAAIVQDGIDAAAQIAADKTQILGEVAAVDERTEAVQPATDLSGYLWAVVVRDADGRRRRAVGIRRDGTLEAVLALASKFGGALTVERTASGDYQLALGTAAGGIPFGDHLIEPQGASTRGELFRLLGTNGDGRRVQVMLIKQDGTQVGVYETPDGVAYATVDDVGAGAALKTRVDRSLTEYGLKIDEEFFRPGLLRQIGYRRNSIRRGASTTLVIGLAGDSWSRNTSYYITAFVEAAIARYGDAGPGWCAFSHPDTAGHLNVNPRGSVVTRVLSGSWASATATAETGSEPTPDRSAISSSTSGDKVTLAYVKPGGGPDIAVAKLFARATANGAARYRWNGGSWTSLDVSTAAEVSGTDVVITDLASVPTGSWTLEVEVVSGTVVLGGVDLQAAAGTRGVRIHALGAAGTRASQWAAVDADSRAASLQALGLHALGTLGGTNDQSAYTATTARGHWETVIEMDRAALPAADLFLISSPENERTNANPMSEYQEMLRQLAHEYGLAHLNLQWAFGDAADVAADYGVSGLVPLIDGSLIHPSAAGANLIADRLAAFAGL